MLRKEDNPQLELFSESGGSPAGKKPKRPFLTRMHGYEKTILTILALLVTAIVSFSIGVEKGKVLAAHKTNLRIDVAEATGGKQAAVQQTLAKKIPAAEQPSAPPAALANAKAYGTTENYTIQLASFSNKASAQKETELLRKKGYEPLVMAKGKYVIICVGNFSDRETASKVLAEFKKRYKDSLVRRL